MANQPGAQTTVVGQGNSLAQPVGKWRGLCYGGRVENPSQAYLDACYDRRGTFSYFFVQSGLVPRETIVVVRSFIFMFLVGFQVRGAFHPRDQSYYDQGCGGGGYPY